MMMFLARLHWFFAASLVAVLMGFAVPASAAEPAEKSFTIMLDGMAVAIDAGEKVIVKGSDGKDVTLQLVRNPEVRFSGSGFSFRHSSDFQVSTSAPADDISQHLIVTGSGTLVLVQSYRNMDPTTLNAFMLNQITADDVAAGSRIAQSAHERTIAEGGKLHGLKAAVTSASDKAEVEVMSAKTGFGGIVAVSRIDLENEDIDRAFVEKFWSTLTLE